MSMPLAPAHKHRLLVLASTFPRWQDDPEPRFVYELSRRMTGHFEVFVLCPHAPGAPVREIVDGMNIIRYRYAPEALETLVNDGGIVTNLRRARWKLGLVPGFVLAQLWWACRLVRTERIDLVHAHWIVPQGLVAVLACMVAGRRVPFLATSHGADLFALRSPPMRWLKRFVVRRAAATTVVSEGMRAPMLALGADNDSLNVEPMGVDLSERFTPDTAAERSRDEVLFVGRLVEKKGLKHLIDAMPLVIQERPGATLTVAGFGPELKERRAQVLHLGIRERVRFLGAVRQVDLPALYRRAAVLVAPMVEAQGGDQDGLGLVLLEALGCGCPVVVSELDATKALSALPGIAVRRWSSPSDLSALVVEALVSPRSPVKASLAPFDWESRARAYVNLLLNLRERVQVEP